MSFTDVFKKSFLDGFSGNEITAFSSLVAMLITCLLALYIFFVYRIITRKTFYSKSFNITLAGVTLITSAIILTIQSSIVVSLGMVGALSIVRFRTAVKDPLDLMFLFWSISVGIICGVGLAEIAVMLSVLLTIGIYVLDHLPVAKAPQILVVNSQDPDSCEQVLGAVRKYSRHYTVKSRNMTADSLDLVVELRTADENALLREILEIAGISSVSLLAHDGEVTF